MPEESTANKPEPRKGELIMPVERKGFQGPTVKKHKLPPIKRVGLAGYCILIILTLSVFSPLLQNNVIWSSYDQTTRSAFNDMAHWTEAWTMDNLRNHDPISLTSYFLEQALPLPTAQAHHGINILLHLVAALLLLRFLQLLQLPGAWFTTLVFALHPATVQTLFWAGYRHEIIGLILILGALYYGVRHHGGYDYALSLLLTIIACIVHPAAFAIPIILALCTLFQKRHFKMQDYNRVLPVLSICLFIGVWAAGAPKTDELELSTAQRIHLVGQNMYFYVEQALIPMQSALFHQAGKLSVQNLNTDLNLLPFVLFIPFFALAIFRIRQKWSRAILLGLIPFLLLLIPGLLQVGTFLDGSLAHEDHALYIALPAVLAFVISGSAAIVRRLKTGARPLWALAIGLLLLFEMTLTASYAYAIRQPTPMWQVMMQQWSSSWVPKAAYIESVRATDPDGLHEQELIDLLENILQKQPELMEMRILLARSYRNAEQQSNALREYKRVLREFNPSDDFLKETIAFYESMGMQWEADNARQRLTTENSHPLRNNGTPRTL